MKVVALVPIKLNNERLPNKNIKHFDRGKPLIQYILNTLIQVKDIDEVYVYCSNQKISNYLPEGVRFMKRSEEFDGSNTKINEILTAFAKDVDADIYVLSHATAPFLKAESIEKGLYNVINNRYDSALSVQKLQEFLWKAGKPYNYDLTNIPRTQDIEPLYKETSGVYIYNKDLIVNHNRRIGYNPYLIEVSKIESIDIDEFEDFEIANAIFNYILLKEDGANNE
jgi:CMP-N-acetylneuraminic acid synthetase